MKLAHLADVHLGIRQYHRLTARGVNQREADVSAAFRAAVEDVIAAAPDVVVIAGDLFHSVRPPNPAILDGFNRLTRLRDGLPRAPIVIVAGNHDRPRSVETGSILKLFEAIGGVHVVVEGVRDLVFDDLCLTITCVPYAAWVTGPRPSLSPPEGTERRVLVTHGIVEGVLPRQAAEYGVPTLEPAELKAERWDYVALGHYHVAHEVRPNAWYSGALEYVSPNPWGELRDEARAGRLGVKGWLLVELGDGATVTLRRVPLARQFVDLEAIQGAGLRGEELDRLIAERVGALPGGLDDQVARLVVYDVPRPVARDLDHAAIRDFKARAVHFHLDLRRPLARPEVGVGAPGPRQTLSDVVASYLEKRLLDAGVDRARLVDLGRRYLDEVEHGLRDA